MSDNKLPEQEIIFTTYKEKVFTVGDRVFFLHGNNSAEPYMCGYIKRIYANDSVLIEDSLIPHNTTQYIKSLDQVVVWNDNGKQEEQLPLALTPDASVLKNTTGLKPIVGSFCELHKDKADLSVNAKYYAGKIVKVNTITYEPVGSGIDYLTVEVMLSSEELKKEFDNLDSNPIVNILESDLSVVYNSRKQEKTDIVILPDTPVYKKLDYVYLSAEFMPSSWLPNENMGQVVNVYGETPETYIYEVTPIKTPPGGNASSLKLSLPVKAIATWADGGRKMSDFASGRVSITAPNKTPVTPNKSQGTTTSWQKFKVYFKVVGDDTLWYVEWKQEEIDKGKERLDWEAYQHGEKDPETVLFTISKEQAAYSFKSKNCMMCAFDATSKFLEYNLGIKMATADATWYKNHPNTEAEGLPFAHTITVLNDLVSVYDIGVSEVFMPKNTSAFEETVGWQKTLGINPLASANRNTSNAEFLHNLGDAAQHVNAKDWGFQYTDSPPEKSFVGMNSLASAASFAGGHGHSSYYSPRESIGTTWKLAIRFDRLENCNRFVPAPTIDYQAQMARVLDVENCKDKTGQLIKTYVTKYVYTPSSSQGYTPPSSNPKGNSLPTSNAKGFVPAGGETVSRPSNFPGSRKSKKNSKNYISPTLKSSTLPFAVQDSSFFASKLSHTFSINNLKRGISHSTGFKQFLTKLQISPSELSEGDRTYDKKTSDSMYTLLLDLHLSWRFVNAVIPNGKAFSDVLTPKERDVFFSDLKPYVDSFYYGGMLNFYVALCAFAADNIEGFARPMAIDIIDEIELISVS